MNAWNPVHDHGCGWADCPLCAAGIEAEIAEKHRKAREWPTRELVHEWQATEREARPEPEVAPKKYRAARKAAEGKLRVKRVLTHEQTIEALVLLKAWPIPKKRSRPEWQSEVWLELVNPTITVARREGGQERKGRPIGLKERVRKAVKRAQDAMKQRRAKESRLVSIETFE